MVRPLRNDDNSKIINKNVQKQRCFKCPLCAYGFESRPGQLMTCCFLYFFFFIRVCICLSAPSICSSLSHGLKCLHLFREFVHSFITFILFSGVFFFFSLLLFFPPIDGWIIWMLDRVHNALVIFIDLFG